jgi:hypothetical protein
MSEEAYSAIRREMDERADEKVTTVGRNLEAPETNPRVLAEDGIRQESIRFQQIQDQIRRYFVARYGEEWTYKAPETFPNALERWMIYATALDNHMAEAEMANIEAKIKAQS